MSFWTLIPQAQAAVDMTAFGNIVNPIITNIVYPIIEFMFGVAIVIFVWGVLQMILKSDEEGRDRGKQTILWGTVGLFIMISAWGIVYVISNTIKGF